MAFGLFVLFSPFPVPSCTRKQHSKQSRYKLAVSFSTQAFVFGIQIASSTSTRAVWLTSADAEKYQDHCKEGKSFEIETGNRHLKNVGCHVITVWKKEKKIKSGSGMDHKLMATGERIAVTSAEPYRVFFRIVVCSWA